MKNIINFFKTLSASDRPYLKIAIIYLAISFLWIVYSDKIIFNTFHDVNSIEYYQLIKGTFFVTGTAILIYFLMRRSYKKVANKNLELTASEKKFRSLLDNLPIGVYYSTITGEFLYGNKAAEKICGYRAEELIGKNFLKLNLLTHKDILKATKLLSLNAMGKTTGPDEFTINRKDGRKIHTEINTHLTQIDDQNVVLGVVKDLTEKVKMDTIVAEWQKLMEYIIKFDPNAIAVLDKDLNFKFVSDRFKEDYRIKNVDIIGKHHYEVFPELPERLREVHQRTLRGEVIREEDDIFIHPDGTESWTKWECRPWYESEGSIGGIILYTEVITKFKELENKLRNRLEYEKLLSRISSMAVSVDDTNIFLDNCLAEIGKTLDVSRVYIFQHDNKLNSVSNTHEWSAKDIKPQKEFLQNIPNESIPWWTETLMQGKNISYADIELIPDNYARELLREQNIISIQVVPLFIEGKYFGFLGFDECRIKRKWPAEDIELLLTLSRIITSTIEQKNAEQALRDNEEKYRKLVELSNDAIFINQGNKITYLNQAALNLFGAEKTEQILGKSPIDIFHPDYHDVIRQRINRLNKGQDKENLLEEKIIRLDGKVVDVEVSGVSFTLNGENAIQVLLRDITERKQAERSLQESEEKFRSLADSAKVMISIIGDSTGSNFLYVNHEWENITGYNNEEALQIRPIDIVHPDMRNQVLDYAAKRTKGIEVPNKYELKIRTKSGETKILDFSSTVINYGNKKVLLTSGIDITQRKYAEFELEESKARLQSIFKSAPIGIGLLVDRVFLQVNEMFCEITGYTAEEVLGKSARILYPSDEEFEFVGREKYAQISRKGTGAVETRWVKKDGTIIDILLSSTPIVTNDLSKGVTFTAQDITERKNAEIALKESEIKYRTVADYNYDWEYWLDTNKKYIYNSPSCERITGYSIDELGNDLQPTINIIHPDDRETMHNHYKEEDLSFRKEFESIEFRIITKNGETKWISHICRKVYDNDNNFIGIRGSNRDITEEKKYKIELEKHSHAIEQSPVSIVITDVNGNIEYVNPMFSKITGYTFKEVKGENPRILKSGKQSDEFYKGLWQTITSGNIWAGVLHNKKKNGELFWESAIISPIKNEKEIITNFIAVKEDITEDVKRDEELKNYRENLEQLVKQRTGELDTLNKELKLQLDRSKILEKQLQESLSKEKEINELKTRFIATVSHEFRTPLSALLSSSQMIQRYSKNWSEEKLKQHYNRIESTVKYLTHILDDVLTISRADREILKNNPELCDINELINSFVEDIKPQLTEKHQLILDINCNKDEINIDRNLLRHIIINLLSNAVKYSPNGGKIELTAECSEGQLIISISDQGLGISEDEIKYIFDPFFRANNSVGIQGTGLGLNIVKRALEILMGEISVESKENVGTTFFVNIPIDNYEQ